jgi:hypothetical protein
MAVFVLTAARFHFPEILSEEFLQCAVSLTTTKAQTF